MDRKYYGILVNGFIPQSGIVFLSASTRQILVKLTVPNGTVPVPRPNTVFVSASNGKYW